MSRSSRYLSWVSGGALFRRSSRYAVRSSTDWTFGASCAGVAAFFFAEGLDGIAPEVGITWRLLVFRDAARTTTWRQASEVERKASSTDSGACLPAASGVGRCPLLAQLTVRNVVLIERLVLDLAPGFNV